LTCADISVACLLSGALENVSATQESPFAASDLDLFVYGLTPEQANAKLRHVADVLSANYRQDVKVVRTKHAVSFIFDYPYRHVQIVLRYVFS